MQLTSTRADVAEHSSAAGPTMTLGWVLKRAAFGLALLIVLMGGMAWLTYASIGPAVDEAVAASSTPASLQLSEQR